MPRKKTSLVTFVLAISLICQSPSVGSNHGESCAPAAIAVETPAPGLTALSPALADPEPLSSNPDDLPGYSESEFVQASTDTHLPPAFGPNPAKVHVIVFSDFQCPVCRRAADAVRQIASEFPGEVRLEFWQNPLTSHFNSENAAVAALAAHRQGKFWEYHDVLFRNQHELDELSLGLYAEGVGLDLQQFKADYADPGLRERVGGERAFAEEIGAIRTPSFMINGKLKEGWSSWLDFRTRVERELAAARELVEQGTPLEEVVEQRAFENVDDIIHFRSYLELALDPLLGAAREGAEE